MNYKVLYRKYRPTKFEDIVGQEYIIKTLKNSIINNNISHAYIFSGPRGTGKTTTAKVFAKAINCKNPKNASPCEECEFCLNFQENPDIIEIDAASNNGVDEIRQLIENIKLTPTNGKYKVYIIDEVHMLTTSAFNALLLTLEEPPSHSIFILATTNIESVPITILSRCQRFDFQKIKNNDIIKRLQEICEIEKINIEEDALKEIAYLSEGGMRDALSLLDQLSKNNEKITVEFMESQIKTISKKTIEDMFKYIENNDAEKFLNLINELRNRSADYKTLIKKMVDYASKTAKNIILTNEQKRLGIIDYKKLILELIDSLNQININVDSYIVLEMIILNFINAKDKENENENNLDKKIIIENNSEQAPLKNDVNNDFLDELVKVRVNNCFCNVQKKYLEETKAKIEKILSTISPGRVKSALLDSQLVASSDKYLIFTMANEHNATANNNILAEIENYLEKELKIKFNIIFLDEERWNNEKQNYIQNLKTNHKYEYIPEPEKNNKEEIINDVFNMSKVEII